MSARNNLRFFSYKENSFLRTEEARRGLGEPGGGEVVELSRGRENDKPHLYVAENGQLLCLLEQPPSSLREGHLSRRCLLNLHDFYLLPNHYSALLSPFHGHGGTRIRSYRIKISIRYSENVELTEKKIS